MKNSIRSDKLECHVAMQNKVVVVVELLRESDLISNLRPRSSLCPIPHVETHPSY